MDTAAAKPFIFICRKAPYSNAYGSACLDLALTTAAFDRRVVLLFMDEGIFQLLKSQDATALGLKNLSRSLPALELYDINEVFVDQTSMTASGLLEEDLIIPVQPLSDESMKALLRDAEQVFTF